MLHERQPEEEISLVTPSKPACTESQITAGSDRSGVRGAHKGWTIQVGERTHWNTIQVQARGKGSALGALGQAARAVICAGFLAASPALHADAKEWFGGINSWFEGNLWGHWDGDTWVPTGVPNASSDVTIASGFVELGEGNGFARTLFARNANLFIHKGGVLRTTDVVGIREDLTPSVPTVDIRNPNSLWYHSGDLFLLAFGFGSGPRFGELQIFDGGSFVMEGGGVFEMATHNPDNLAAVRVVGPNSLFRVNKLVVAKDGWGVLEVRDGALARVANGMSLTGSESAIAQIDLLGKPGSRGVLETGKIGLSGGVGRIVFDGGVLQPAGSSANDPDFIKLYNDAELDLLIETGGAFIDTFHLPIGGSVPSFIGIQQDFTGFGGLTKAGAGALILYGPKNNYFGPTIVMEGFLHIDGTLVNSPVEVLANAVLGGTGTIQSSIVVREGGTLAPGGLTESGALTTRDVLLEPGSFLQFDLFGPGFFDSDFLDSEHGVVSFDGAELLLTLHFQPSVDAQFLLARASSFQGLLTWDGQPLFEGSIFTATTGEYSQTFSISYAYPLAGSDNNLVIVAIPEPKALPLVILVAAWATIGLLRRRFVRHK